MKNWRITIQRNTPPGFPEVFVVRDVECESSKEATVTALREYREKYHESADGQSHWVKSIVQIERKNVTNA